jgi:hypothetical protein
VKNPNCIKIIILTLLAIINKSALQKSEGASHYVFISQALTVGRNLYPYNNIPRSSPSSRTLRVTISTGMPISTARSSRSVSCAVTTGPSFYFTIATV